MDILSAIFSSLAIIMYGVAASVASAVICVWGYRVAVRFMTRHARKNAERNVLETEEYLNQVNQLNEKQIKIRDKTTSDAKDHLDFQSFIAYAIAYSLFGLIMLSILTSIGSGLYGIAIGLFGTSDFGGIFNIGIGVSATFAMVIAIVYVLPRTFETLRLFLADYPKGKDVRAIKIQNGKVQSTICPSCESFFAIESWSDNKNVLSAVPRQSRDVSNFTRSNNGVTEHWVRIKESSWTEVRYTVDLHVACCVCEYHQSKTIEQTEKDGVHSTQYERRA